MVGVGLVLYHQSGLYCFGDIFVLFRLSSCRKLQVFLELCRIFKVRKKMGRRDFPRVYIADVRRFLLNKRV